MRILALVPGGIGDQILFFPTLENLKRAYPSAKIDVIAEPRAQGAYRVCKFLHDKSLQVLKFDFKDRNGLADWGNLLGIMRDVEYDAVLWLGQIWTVGLLLWLTGIPKRIGYVGNGSNFLTNAVPRKTEQYTAQMYHDLLQGFDIHTPCPELAITPLKEDIQWAENQQQKLGIKESGYILIHGGASEMSALQGIDKIYPVEHWQKIVKDLQKRQPQMPIAILQGPEDADWVGKLLNLCPALKVFTPSNVGQLAATIAGANLMLCTDSAPMHLAVAVQTYTIALFGPTDPKKLLPTSPKFTAIPSGTGKMADISPQTVLKTIWGEA